jgi:hypothetical protein
MTPPKTPVPGKVDKDNNNNKKFKIKKDKSSEVDIEIEIEEDGDYTVTKLSIDDLDTELPNNGGGITWLNNFEIKENNNPINKAYKIKVPGLSAMLAAGKKLVIQDGNRNNSKPYLHDVPVTDDTFDFSDGDPAVGTKP